MTYRAEYWRLCVLAFFLFAAPAELTQAQELWHIFCSECTSLASNTRLSLNAYQYPEAPAGEYQELLDTVLDFEQGLNPQYPEKSKIVPEVIGYGSTSLGFRIPDWEHFLIRRLAGFPSFQAARKHIFLINWYRSKLHELQIQTTSTQLIALSDHHGYGVVYVIQPYLSESQLSKKMFKKFGTRFKQNLLKKQADTARDIISHNLVHPESAITIDIVNNNWEIINFDSATMSFEIRLNDLAQPLFKENNELTYDFHDQAFAIIYPLSSLIVQGEMIREFTELFNPRNLMMQALWGYDEPADFFYSCYLWIKGAPLYRGYPQWAMDTVNEVLESFGYDTITSWEAFQAHLQDKNALACMRLYRELTQNIRGLFGLHSNVYMNPGQTVVEMYSGDQQPGYIECFKSALN